VVSCEDEQARVGAGGGLVGEGGDLAGLFGLGQVGVGVDLLGRGVLLGEEGEPGPGALGALGALGDTNLTLIRSLRRLLLHEQGDLLAQLGGGQRHRAIRGRHTTVLRLTNTETRADQGRDVESARSEGAGEHRDPA
jgi:hypothetical protein